MFEYVTVAVQAACELAISRAMRRLVADQAGNLLPALERLIGNRYDLADRRVSDLWNALASDEIQEADFWRPYRGHLVRRHGVVHEGRSVSRAEAEESIEVAHDLCDHVTQRSP